MIFQRMVRRLGSGRRRGSADRRVALSLPPGAGGGSHSFGRVLAEYLPRYGLEVTFDLGSEFAALVVFAQHADVERVRRLKTRGTKILHRVDERLEPGVSEVRREKHRIIGSVNALADETIYQSHFARVSMAPVCRCPRWRVIHNGVDRRIFNTDGPRVELAGEPRVLHVSWSVGESKRLDRIGELLSVLPSTARVYLVGRHSAADLPAFRDPRVVMLGVRDREEVARLMRSADLLFFPSENDPCPNTVIEAMACGLPVLHHPSGGTVELVGGAGIPLSGSLRDDVAAVMEARAVLRARGQARAEELSADRVVGQYAEAILSLIDAREEGTWSS